MASATAVYERVLTTVNITLTIEEASALKRILGVIAGDPNTTIRRHLDPIYEALDKSGVSPCKEHPKFKASPDVGNLTYGIHIVE